MYCHGLPPIWTYRNGVCCWIRFSYLSYCPVVWMFHSRDKNNKINRLHERCLRIIFIVIRNPPLLNYWIRIFLSQFINKTYVFLATEKFKFKRGLSLHYRKKWFHKVDKKGTHCETMPIFLYLQWNQFTKA